MPFFVYPQWKIYNDHLFRLTTERTGASSNRDQKYLILIFGIKELTKKPLQKKFNHKGKRMT